MMKRMNILAFALLMTGIGKTLPTYAVNQPDLTADVCVYGATSAGITAACTVKGEGKSVVLIEPSGRIGGLTAGGLGQTDVGKMEAIRGMSLDFYRRVGRKYASQKPVVTFEPKVALQVYKEMLAEAGVEPVMWYRIVKVKKQGNVLKYIVLEPSLKNSGKKKLVVAAREFIDCSYEGDLMGRAGVTYTVGREANSQYGETYNGVQMLEKHQFPDGVDPYKVRGDKKSGLVYGVLPQKMGKTGEADKHVQAYNFRITLTKDPANKIEITRPENYDSTRYELLVRLHELDPWKNLWSSFMWSPMPNQKTDINNWGGFSTDMIGANWRYPEASYKEREKIFKAHLDYTKGLLYFVGHDKRIPEFIRKMVLEWGYPKDEYEESDHFTPQLYIREARRLVGPYVMTQANCERLRVCNDSVGWAAYGMDSHNSGRYVVNGMVKNEGDVQIWSNYVYPVSYRSLTPFEREASNLLVPVCLSASHIAYGSIRMEPVFMVLGQTSAIAACLAIDEHRGVVQRVGAGEVMNRFFAWEKQHP